jgi:hypothetical protein
MKELKLQLRITSLESHVEHTGELHGHYVVHLHVRMIWQLIP